MERRERKKFMTISFCGVAFFIKREYNGKKESFSLLKSKK